MRVLSGVDCVPSLCVSLWACDGAGLFYGARPFGHPIINQFRMGDILILAGACQGLRASHGHDG
jgi:hypothetical protein